MATWFRTRWEKIQTIEIIKSTSASVWVNGHRRAKRSDFDSYFETWAEAHASLLQAATERVNSYQRSLDYAKGKLGNIKGLKPEDATPVDE